MSGLLNQFSQYSFSPDGQPVSIYGDPAYPPRVYLQCPFAKRPNLTDAEQAYNRSMSRVPISAECIFGDIINYFEFTNLKII